MAPKFLFMRISQDRSDDQAESTSALNPLAYSTATRRDDSLLLASVLPALSVRISVTCLFRALAKLLEASVPRLSQTQGGSFRRLSQWFRPRQRRTLLLEAQLR